MKAASIDRKNFIPYPTNRVVGTIVDADQARAAIDALLARRIRPRGHRHPARRGGSAASRSDRRRTWVPGAVSPDVDSRLRPRGVQATDAVRRRRARRSVRDHGAGERRGLRISAAEILHQYGADFVEFYGRWSCEDVPATAQTSPEDIPALFARAWNGRDPAALAVLFDEDAEFVSVDGRRARPGGIRKWHAARLARESNTSTVVTSDTLVKLLSSEFAVVHARLTLSDERRPAVAPRAARTTIVSFVVHRAGDKWMCASAQATNVIAEAETGVSDQADAIALPTDPGSQVS